MGDYGAINRRRRNYRGMGCHKYQRDIRTGTSLNGCRFDRKIPLPLREFDPVSAVICGIDSKYYGFWR